MAEGTTLVKFWLHISAEEQLARFESRRDDPLRRWKLTEEDWRNRAKRPAYAQAVEEMLSRTDHSRARWHVVAAESKQFARVKVVETVVHALEQRPFQDRHNRAARRAGRAPGHLTPPRAFVQAPT